MASMLGVYFLVGLLLLGLLAIYVSVRQLTKQAEILLRIASMLSAARKATPAAEDQGVQGSQMRVVVGGKLRDEEGS